MSEEKEIDEGEILKALVKQGAFSAAKEYVDFLEKKAKEIDQKIEDLRTTMPEKTTTVSAELTETTQGETASE